MLKWHSSSEIVHAMWPPQMGLTISQIRRSLHVLPGAEHLYMFDPAGAGARLLADFFSSENVATSDAWMTGMRASDFVGEAV